MRAAFSRACGARASALPPDFCPALRRGIIAIVLCLAAPLWSQTLQITSVAAPAVAAEPFAPARSAALDIDTLIAAGRIDEARQVARTAADHTPDESILARAAALEDRYGTDSPRYYQSLVEAMRSAGQPESAWRAAAERGMRASIRHRQTANCQWFAALIHSNLCTPEGPSPDTATILVPGGLRALMYIAGGPQKPAAAKFSLADFSRTLTSSQSGMSPRTADAWRNNLATYFRQISELRAMGQTVNGKTRLGLSLVEFSYRSFTEHVLDLLGWRTRLEAGSLVVELSTESPRALHRDLATALGADVVAMQESLQSGKEFILEITDETVGVFPSESVWRSQFYADSNFAGGFAEALVREPVMNSLYTALSDMEPGTANMLIGTMSMRRLAAEYVGPLTLYSSCLDFSAGHVEVPGGAAALPVWTTLAGVPQSSTTAENTERDPRRFLTALLTVDEGRLFRFYFVISQLDLPRQRFFTASHQRAKAIYDAFLEYSRTGGQPVRRVDSPAIEDFFRELPLDETGRVLFPGGSELWQREVWRRTLPGKPGNRSGQLSRVTTPEIENQILSRLIRSEYVYKNSALREWQNFLAVVRVEAARPEPLNYESALLLAESYAGHRSLYAYFAGLSGLDTDHYRGVLRMDEQIQALDRGNGNTAAGLLHSVLYLLSATERSGRIAPDRTAALLSDFAGGLSQNPSPAQWSRSSLEFVGYLLDSAGVARSSPSFCELLVPVTGNQSPAGGDRCSRVLELQSIPPLDDLLTIHSALENLYAMNGDPLPAIQSIARISRKFNDVDAPRDLRLSEYDKGLLESSPAPHYTELSVRMQKEAAGGRANPKNLQKLAGEYWGALSVRTMFALTGQVYAANFRPEDLLVADDPFFIRKHRFVPPETTMTEPFASGRLDIANDAGGSRITGGFDAISMVAGQAAAGSLRDLDGMSLFVASALLGSVRATDWSRVDQASVRAVAVQIHAAQDWLVLAASEPAVYDALRASTVGLISFSRRARLLSALQRRDWEAASSVLSLSDLLALADSLRGALAKSPGSPSIDEFRAAGFYPQGVPGVMKRRSGPGSYELAATAHPAQLGERVAEFNLYLMRLYAEQALPAATLPSVAETVTRAVLSDIRMTNSGDWHAVLNAYEAFDAARLRVIIGAM